MTAPSAHPHRYALIMAGGSGTRLWPMSRVTKPKQLLPLIGGKSMLQLSSERLEGLIASDKRLVCASCAYASDVLASISALAPHNFLGEPVGRDTLNAIGFAAAVLFERDPDAIFAVMTSDHVIEPHEAFCKAVDTGFALVEADPRRLVTFSVPPTFAATGYGYVERGAAIAGFDHAFRAKRFIEKPDLARATEFVANKSFGWNTGMFVFHARTVLDAIGWFMPQNAAGLARIGAAWGTRNEDAVITDVYPTLTKISVDFGLMEPASRDERLAICVVPMEVSWRDVGNWQSFGAVLAADAQGNRTVGAAVHLESNNVVVASDDPNHLIATIGVEGLVIVHTRDATLICPAAMAERVKDLAGRVPSGYQ
ncbi:MAG: mannose-1-phosphate guanylyltransferase [Phycisphaerales bacterium]|nr:mannose-1-phosphate guanylyltransferase [Phycisphaerales bacterium]